jgi:hypothetical protein
VGKIFKIYNVKANIRLFRGVKIVLELIFINQILLSHVLLLLRQRLLFAW